MAIWLHLKLDSPSSCHCHFPLKSKILSRLFIFFLPLIKLTQSALRRARWLGQWKRRKEFPTIAQFNYFHFFRRAQLIAWHFSIVCLLGCTVWDSTNMNKNWMRNHRDERNPNVICIDIFHDSQRNRKFALAGSADFKEKQSEKMRQSSTISQPAKEEEVEKGIWR